MPLLLSFFFLPLFDILQTGWKKLPQAGLLKLEPLLSFDFLFLGLSSSSNGYWLKFRNWASKFEDLLDHWLLALARSSHCQNLLVGLTILSRFFFDFADLSFLVFGTEGFLA